MAKKVALGKGIASLIQETPNQILAKSLTENEKIKSNNEINSPLMVSVTQIKANPNQPRKIFKEKELEELSNSIKENGILMPLIVMKAESGFELIAGERRLRAAKKAGVERVPVLVKRATDKEKMVMSIIENVQRSDLNCVEEALAYYSLMDEFSLTQEEVAKKLGKERSTVANYLRILKLPREVIELVQKELLSFGHAKIIAAIKERELAINVANEVATKNLSVRETEDLIKKSNRKTITKKKETNKYFAEKLNTFKDKLEQRTGFHFNMKAGKGESGEVVLKFSNEAEFNDIFEYLMTKR